MQYFVTIGACGSCSPSGGKWLKKYPRTLKPPFQRHCCHHKFKPEFLKHVVSPFLHGLVVTSTGIPAGPSFKETVAMSGVAPNSLSDVDDVITTSDAIAKLPEWMETVGKSMAARADAVVRRPQLVGELNAEKIREIYRKMTAKDMQTWVFYRDGRESEVGKTKPDKKKEFKKMYPLLNAWMNKHGHSLKSENVTPKALGMLALANAVQVHN